MAGKLILVEEEMNRAVITLNREEKRNALSVEMRKELTDLLSRLAQNESVKAVVLTGRGSVFSAGFDTSEFSNLTADKVRTFFEESLQYHLDIITFPKPILAALNGPAIAGGLDLALMCDFRIASDTAFVQHPEIRFGATPLYILLKPVVGDGLARDISFTGRRVDAQEALRIGLFNRVVPVNEVLTEALHFAAEIVESKLETLMAVKRMCIAAMDIVEFKKVLADALG